TWDKAAHGVGKIAMVTSPEGQTVETEYDTFSRPNLQRLSIDSETFALGLGYDVFGRLSKEVYPGAHGVPLSVQNGYDDYAHLLSVKEATTNYWTLASTDTAGRPTGETFDNGVTTALGWDEAKGRVATISTTTAKNAALQALSYAYDDKLNLAS